MNLTTTNLSLIESLVLIEDPLKKADIESPKVNDLMWWRSILLSYKAQKEDISKREAVRDSILKIHDVEIEKKKTALVKQSDFIKNSLEASPFKTKTGGFKIDNFPEIGSIALDKVTHKFNVEDEDYWKSLGYTRTVPEKTEIDKTVLNNHLRQMVVHGNTVIDPETGEVQPGIKVISSRTFKDWV